MDFSGIRSAALRTATAVRGDVSSLATLTFHNAKSFLRRRTNRTRPQCYANFTSVLIMHESYLPTFVIIGAQKSATRWLRSNMAQHPEVYAAPREIHFFNNRYKLGLEWYKSNFDQASFATAIGEATPGYMMWRHSPPTVACRMHSVIPEAKLLAILRNPIDRAISAFIHHKKRGRIDKSLDFMTYIKSTNHLTDPRGIIAGGWYGSSLFPFLEVFGDNVLILLNEHVASHPQAVYDAALRHCDVGSPCTPSSLFDVMFSNRQPESASADGTEYIGEVDRDAVWEHFDREVNLLERLSGLDLSGWR